MKAKHLLACLTVGTVLVSSLLPVNAATYTIQQGDTLGKIASETGMSVNEIMKANGIKDANKIVAGKTLILDNLPASVQGTSYKSLYDLFDATYYAEKYPDVASAVGTSKKALYKHFMTYGMKEGRSLSSIFDVNAYKSAYPDLVNAFGDDVAQYYNHFLTFGQQENRTLITKDACIEAGITVSDFNGTVIASPVVHQPTNTSNNTSDDNADNDDNNVEDEYWKTGFWVNCCADAGNNGPLAPKGDFPYALGEVVEETDEYFTMYVLVNHGAWKDGQYIDLTPDDSYDKLKDYAWYKFNAVAGYNFEYISTEPYNQGCVHLLKVTSSCENHYFVEEGGRYRCPTCNSIHDWSFNYPHIDKDNDGHCDICNIYCAEHECIEITEGSQSGTCSICGNHTPHYDNDNDTYCDMCGTLIKK